MIVLRENLKDYIAEKAQMSRSNECGLFYEEEYRAPYGGKE
jgi:hypothetical protein